MSIHETFPSLDYSLWTSPNHPTNRAKDHTAGWWAFQLDLSIGRCKSSGNTYAQGSWGYTVLRTDESDTLWPIAIEKLNRWVTQYFIHETRLMGGKTDASVNEELGRRFILEVIEDKESRKLSFPSLTKATQDDIKSLTKIFDEWVRKAIGDIKIDPRDSPRFCDFLIIDEDSLRSVAALPNDTPSLGPASMMGRRGRQHLYYDAYVWLVDSQAVKRFQGVEDDSNYNGWMKLNACNLTYAWFERLPRFETEDHIFERREIPEGSGEMWYWAR